jgi:hypothetical protein
MAYYTRAISAIDGLTGHRSARYPRPVYQIQKIKRMSEAEDLAQFRAQLREARERSPDAWERSRRLVNSAEVPKTIQRLSAALRQDAALSSTVKDLLEESLRHGEGSRIQDLSADTLKRLTGLSATKAVRALCLFFGMLGQNRTTPTTHLSAEEIERFVRLHTNPYDLLLEADVASLLDLGAGDLSFVEEIADRYGHPVAERKSRLVLHAVDRLRPGSRFGGPLQVPQARLEKLSALGTACEFGFWGDLDMFALDTNPHLWPVYTMVTCHAPPNPTFAYEPHRLVKSIITRHLIATKGQYRNIQVDGEPALEVDHGGKALLFPPWKFEIRGPLALLDLLSRRGRLCVLSSIDTEVFWELLSQLIADPDVRPADVVFTPAVVPPLFGTIYKRLSTLPVGEQMSLGDLTALRKDLPRVLEKHEPAQKASYGFRTVLVRRGATFPGMPASLTARLFKDMKEEAPPWLLILVT